MMAVNRVGDCDARGDVPVEAHHDRDGPALLAAQTTKRACKRSPLVTLVFAGAGASAKPNYAAGVGIDEVHFGNEQPRFKPCPSP